MSSDASDPVLIGIDWGTSSLRAFLMASDGAILDHRQEAAGILSVKNGAFEPVFERMIGGWTANGSVPIIASGMITSRSGWLETPYQVTPCGPAELADAIVSHKTSTGKTVNFITGIRTENNGVPDIMRGEETQIIGVAAKIGGKFVIPGTHSKWIEVRNGRIEAFSTYMTGELFAALKNHTILGAFIGHDCQSEDGFRLGVEAGLTGQPSLLHRLFHVRTLPLFEKIQREQTGDYLSGLLIGAEIAAVRSDIGDHCRVTCIANEDLGRRYGIALDMAGIPSDQAPGESAALGQYIIAKTAGLLSLSLA